MKLLSVSALSAVAMANDISSMWNTAIKNSADVIATMAEDSPSLRGSGERNVMDLFTLSNVFNYGCWCHFGDSNPARGPVMDDVDGFCHTWYNSKDCVVIDAENEDRLCDISMQYEDVLSNLNNPFNPSHNYENLCNTANSNVAAANGWDADTELCAQQNCMVDAYFLRDIFNHMAFNNLNNSLSQAFGFDKMATCRGLVASSLISTHAPLTTEAPVEETTVLASAGTTAAPINVMECCGSFPHRFPYKTRLNTRDCCITNVDDEGNAAPGAGVSYDINSHACCANVLQPFGTC